MKTQQRSILEATHRHALALLSATTVLFGAVSATQAADVVISQVYGGGGNSGATYTHDFIEIFNRGACPVDLAGWSVQYASSAGSAWSATPLSGTIPAGGYYLVQESSAGATGVALPTADATGSIIMAAGAGKVALLNTITPLTVACASGGSIIDFVGYGGTANCREGASSSDNAPVPSATLSVQRNTHGCTDTDNNAADFTAVAVVPRNSQTTIAPCGVVNTPPTISCPGNITQNTDPGVCTASVTWSTTTTGTPSPAVQCLVSGGVLPVNTLVTSPYSFPKGTTTISCTAVNPCGATASCAFDVTVVDNEPPSINIGQNETVSCMQGWDFTVPIVSDNCDGLISGNAAAWSTVTNASCGYTFTATRIWQVADSSMNVSYATQVVTYVDFIPPTIASCPANQAASSLAAIPPPNPSLVIATHQFDPCETTPPIVTFVGDVTTGVNPIIVTRTYRASDQCGNAVTCEQKFFTQPAVPTVVYVDDNWAAAAVGSEVEPGKFIGLNAFATMQAGVSGVASGGTVHVAAGTYPELVTVSAPMAILGANAGVDPRTSCNGGAVRGPESVIDGMGIETAIAFSSSGVTLDGFTIQGGCCDGLNAGLHMGGGFDNNTVQNNIIRDNSIGIFPNCAGPLPTVIRRNLFDANNTGGPGSGSGIYVDGSSALRIVENEFSNHTASNPMIIGATGPGSHVGLEVAGNNFLVSNSAGSAIYAVGITGGTFARNQIASPFTGIRLGGANTSVAIANNFFTAATVGVRVVDDGYGLGLNSAITITGNSFSGMTAFAVANESGYATPPLDASGNWWGASSLAAVTAGIDVGGGPVDFTPWLDTGIEPVALACDGFQGDFSTLHVDDDSPQAGSVGRIQEGINLVIGSTVLIGPGNYLENDIIGPSLAVNLIGSGSGANPAVDSIITAANAALPVILVDNIGGSSAANRLVIRNLRLLNGADGLSVSSTSGSHRFYNFDNLAALGHTGSGIRFTGTASLGDAMVANSTASNNGLYGLFVDSTLASFDTLLVTGSTFTDNDQNGLFASGLDSNPTSPSGVQVVGCVFTSNGAVGNGGSGDVSFFLYNGDAGLLNVNITSDSRHPIQFRGKNPFLPSGVVGLTNVTVTGTGNRPALYIQQYADLNNVRLDTVDLSGYVPPLFPAPFSVQMLVEHTGAAPLNLGKLKLKTTYLGGAPAGTFFALAMSASGGAVASCDTIVVGAVDTQDLEDAVVDKQDNPALGDIVFPTFSVNCPADVVNNCGGPGGAVVSYSLPTVSGGCSPGAVTCLPPSGSTFPPGPTTVNCSSTDSRPITATCSFSVSVILDAAPPTITCPGDVTVLANDLANCQATGVALGTPATSDNCLVASVVNNHSTSTYPVGVTTVIWTVTDGAGNTAQCSQLVTVIETVPPLVSVPADTTVECGTDTSPAATGSATATDNCDANPMVNYFDQSPVEIQPLSMGSWALAAQNTGAATLVDGIGTPPLLTGSLHLTVGADGTGIGEGRNTAFHNTLLNSLTELNYWAYRVAPGGADNQVMLVLNIDTDGNGSDDDVIFFEPRYQTPATGNPILPNQGAIVNGVWQKWNALHGGWYSRNHPTVASPGVAGVGNAGVKPLAVYLAAFPNARIVNNVGGGGVHLAAGSGLGIWQNFEAYADAISVGVGGASTTYNFELIPALNCALTHVTDILIRVWTATDGSGNENSSSQIIRVQDLTAPLISAAGPAMTIDCPAAPVFTAPTASDTCDVAPLVVEVSDVTVPGLCPGTYVRTKTWKAVDACGNESPTVSQTITVQDVTAPLISAAGPAMTVDCPAAPVFTAPTASDTCDAAPLVVEVSDVTVPGGCPGTYVRTKTWKAVDACGNTSPTVSQTITVQDLTAPVISAAGPAMTIDCPATPVFTAPTASDTCDVAPLVVEVGDVTVPGLCPGSYVRTKTWKAVDACGNESPTVSQTITVQDVTAPLISAAGPAMTVDCPAAPVFTVPTASDTCDVAPLVVEVGDVTVPGLCPGTYVRTKTWKAVDACGNESSTVSQTITVQDLTAPTLTSVCPANVSVPCAGSGTAVSFASPTAADTCDAAPVVTCTPPSGTMFPVGTTVVTCSAVDACGNNSVPCTFSVTVFDAVSPIITCPVDAVVECPNPTTPAATGFATATDGCDLTPSISSVDAAPIEITAAPSVWSLRTTSTGVAGYVNGPAVPPLQSGSVRLAVGSDSGALAETRLTGFDGTRLTNLTELAYSSYRTTVPSGGANENVVLLIEVDINGDAICDDVLVFEPEWQGSPVMTGSWQRWNAHAGKWWSQNFGGNALYPGAGTRSVSGVKSLSSYLAHFPGARICGASGLPGVALRAGLVFGAWANFDGNADFFCLGVKAPSLATTCYNFESTPGNQCPVLDIIARTWTATDDSGNQVSCTQAITVRDTVAPVLAGCVDISTTNDLNLCTAVVNFAPTATDACTPSVSVVCLPPSGSAFPIGATVVTCSSSDACGNPASCSFTVTVSDAQAPSIAACAPAQVGVADLACQALVPDFTGGVVATDCTMLTITQSPAGGTSVGLGTTVVTLTVKDAANNTTTCTANFVVTDMTAPVIATCAPGQTAVADALCAALVPDFTAGVAATDCNGPLVVTQVPAAGTLVGLGTTTVTLTVKDAANNTTTCTTSFAVADTTAPVIATCAPNQSAVADTLCQALVPDFTAGVVASDCNGPLVVTQVPAAGTLVGLGTTLVTLTVKDAANNSATCTANFVVADTTAPVIATCAPNQSAVADALCAALVPDFTAGVVASDCNGPLVITQSPAAGTSVGLGTTVVTLTVKDAANNSATCTANFVVTDTTAPVIATCAPGQAAVADALCAALVPDFTAGVVASDCNGPLVITQSPAAGTSVGLGTTVVTLTVKDAANNSATCTANFVVTDTTAPVLTTGTIGACYTTEADALAAAIAATTAQDNCDGAPVKSAVKSGPDCTATITVVATDVSGNASLPVVYSTRIDPTDPVIASVAATQSALEVKNCANPTLQGTVTIAVVASDNCGIDGGHPSVTLLNGMATATATFLSGSGTVLDPFLYTWNVSATTAKGTWTVTVAASDLCRTITDTFTLCVNPAQITGNLQLEGFIGTGTVPTLHTRTVTFVATKVVGVTTNILKTWVIDLSNVSGDTFAYTLTGVPPDLTNLSAKTDWNKRRNLPVTLDVNCQGVANFTGAGMLKAADIGGAPVTLTSVGPPDNRVNLADYSQLVLHWLEDVSAIPSAAVADIDGDGVVNFNDYVLLGLNWFTVGDPE